jgi:DNA-directed RNA polymerase specialized sigma subunit
VQSSTITPATAIASVPAAIDTLSEEQISSINSYGYKIIVISKALANLNDEKRNLLIHNIENPYVDNLQLFKEIILESIHNLDNSEQNIISYAHLINDTTWSLVEINTIIRKGILLLDS